MKGSAITGPVGKEAAELWPVGPSSLWYSNGHDRKLTEAKRIASNSGVVM